MWKAIITGAARGIGRATALRLAQDAVARGDRAELLLVDLDAGELDGVCAQIAASGGHATSLVADMTAIDASAAAVAACVSAYGGVSLIVSNAGGGQAGPIAEIALEDWDRAFHLNTRATLALAKAGYPHLKAAQGQIVILASVSGMIPQPFVGGYSASKAATIMLARQLALEWGRDGVRTNVVSPGMIHTSLTDYRLRHSEQRAAYAALVPLQDVGDPDDIAGAVAYFAGPDGRYCNGTNLVVDGGYLQTLANQVPVVAQAQRR